VDKIRIIVPADRKIDPPTSCGGAVEAKVERIASRVKRLGDLKGFACAFPCSAQAGFITGQNLTIDGGAFPGAF
jgi:3-oxoacyl-[acyl-carrier protein] reductase